MSWTEMEAREEEWLEGHTHEATVRCCGCGRIEEDRVILDDEGEAAYGCTNVLIVDRIATECMSTAVERA